MELFSVSAVRQVHEPVLTSLVPNRPAEGTVFLEKLNSIDATIKTAESAALDYLRGEQIPVHEVMIALGKAKSELTLAVEMRNRLVSAYESIVSMQI